MRNFLHLSLLFVLLSASLSAQEKPVDMLRLLTSDVMRQSQISQMKSAHQSFWTGRGTDLMLFGFVQHDEFKEALGVTAEQEAELKNAGHSFHTNPEVSALMVELQKFQADPYFENASQETIQAFLTGQARLAQLMLENIHQEMGRIFTADQKRQLQEILISGMEFIPILNPEMFEALDLTDEQRSEIKAIQEELAAEFETVANDLAEGQYAGLDLIYQQMKKDGVTAANMQELYDRAEETVVKLRAQGIDYKAAGKDKINRAQEFVKKFKFQMFDVLTDAQMDKLSDLINNPPKHAKVIVARLKKNHEARSKAGAWQPGAHSWQPGDPVPEEYTEQRKARFPRKVNQ